ncbi:winged helix DNA-binding domain-containing protein [Phytoactinopolyspora halotolerans]|uniref:Winged helix DNA-binding domain-containing protein n=1 Tax=Phytoactinopolyspora halotolerans TaxID=1981512 RepID=A0A6L9S7R4_9ACTN|nr:winged helix DNA-binding domain-containing protein [Phytoactinopolyspora halotolerans]NEE01139.1 winged helix DNA-binding domain-containing protein [Phytoactinopolyspora halotolerans]
MPRSTSASGTSGDVLQRRALNRATLERQLLLRRSDMSPLAAVEHLVGLQAQAPFSPYYQLWSRLRDFDPHTLGQLLLDRQVVRIVVMRGTIHLLSAADCATLRPLTQPIMDRDLGTNTQYAAGIRGLDLDHLAAVARAVVEEEPRSNAELAAVLAERFPERDRSSLAYAARGLLPLVQVPPRAVWGRSAQARLTTAEAWLGRGLDPAPSIDAVVLRYLAAFGPGSVADVQTWSGLTRLREVVERLRPELRTFRTEEGKELFDLPDAPRPDPDTPAPPRFLPDFDNVLRSHTDRTRLIDPEDMKRMHVRNGVTPSFFLVDGVVAGTWRLTVERKAATLRITPFRRLPRAEQPGLVEEGERLLAMAASDAETRETVVDDPI